MCNPASMVVVFKNRAKWSKHTDSHARIIAEYELRETDARGDIALVPVEILPPKGNLSLPLEDWVFKIDHAGYRRDLPYWWDARTAEESCRTALVDWAEAKLSGWRVKEAFKPINPLTLKCEPLPEERLIVLLANWDSVGNSVGNSVGASVRNSVGNSVGNSVWDSVWANVRNSVGNSVWDGVWANVRNSVGNSVGNSVWANVRNSVGNSVRNSVWNSVGNSVWDSVWDSVWAYTGSLFPNVTEWRHLEGNTDPWASVRTLWVNGYVPSFDGKTWRLHRGPKAKVVLKVNQRELSRKTEGTL